MSDSMSTALASLERKPDMTPAELAALLSVSRDYARTLLRRARTKLEVAPPAPIPVRAPAPVVAKAPQSPNKKKTRRPEVAPQDTLVTFPSAPLQPVSANRRSQVLRLAEHGESPKDVASAVGMPVGEVEFILKVDRMLRTAL
jgi:DNA-directed RNA polymerase specialized sigma24 family protein